MTRHLPTLPLTRGECREWILPCRLTRCRYHLDHVTRKSDRGQWAGPGRGRFAVSTEPRQRIGVETCALNIAELGPQELTEIGIILGLTKSRIKQIEDAALERLSKRGKRLRELID